MFSAFCNWNQVVRRHTYLGKVARLAMPINTPKHVTLTGSVIGIDIQRAQNPHPFSLWLNISKGRDLEFSPLFLAL